MKAQAKLNRTTRLLMLALTIIGVGAIAFKSTVALAADAAGNRPPYNTPETNAKNKCASEGWQALRYGAIWFTNSSSYYAGTVNIGATDSSVTVNIRGSVYGCHHPATNNTYALNVTPAGANGWRLSGLSGTSLYRGQSQGAHNWSTQGGQISATLNVSGLATNNASGPDTQTIYIDLYRCFSTNPSIPTGSCYAESIPVTVIREAQPVPPPACSISASPNPIVAGMTSTISWSSTNATSMTINVGSTEFATGTSGTKNDNPTSNRTYTGTVSGPGGNGSCSANLVVYAATNCTPSPTIVGRGQAVTLNVTGGNPSQPYSWSGGGSPPTGSGTSFTTTFTIAGSYTITVTNSGISDTCLVEVVNQPFHRVYGGDTLTGVGLTDSSGSCPASSVISGKRQMGFVYQQGSNWNGAGNSHANFATGTIVEFISGVLEPGPTNPKTFAFANTVGAYGGGFAAQLGSACAPDYYSQLPPGTPTVSSPTSPGSLSTGNYLHNGNLRLTGGTLGSNVRATLYVDGDVFIGGNITYTGSGGFGSDPTTIPSFKLVARGNIYVSPGVSQLSGIYIAQRTTSGTKGVLYTCGFDRGSFFSGPVISSGSGSASSPYISNELVTACDDNILTVYGAVLAHTIKFLRTAGTIPSSPEGFSPSSAGERFIYTPDTWFNGSPSTNKPFQSYTALPPIL